MLKFARALLPVVASLLLLAACRAPQEVQPEPAKRVLKKVAAKADKKAQASKDREAPAEPEKFVVPFAWEAAKDEPLAVTRSFLRDAIGDNATYMAHGDAFFAAFAEKQTPRATVITCADSRVHAQAWDASPENDDFLIRDIGNQVENVEGSVEYGVEHLNTPLLLVVGHTGCGAVKAAMDGISKLSEPIRRELEHLKVPPPSPGKAPEVAWAEAVIANVNDQVGYALKRFGHEVHEGKLTIVGTVYDFRNDLGQGAGKLVIVNVNGNSDPERMLAFIDAVNAHLPGAKETEPKPKSAKRDAQPKEKKEKRPTAEPASSADVAAAMAKIRGLSVTGDVAPTGRSAIRGAGH